MSLCDAGYATALLDIWVRQREVLTLGQAVHKLTVAPAALFGIPNRGMLAEGSMADLVLFDPQAGGDRRHLCRGDPGVRAGHVYEGVPRPRVAQ
jgi:N-acyl-D-aspartate/D-glutamate deacylase